MSKCIGSIKSRLKAVGSRIRKGCEAISISLEELAKKAKALKLSKVVFDRGGYLYAGKIKAVADGAREGGLKF